jgi:uncharacterized membrane protein YraQ (UPF0718 family)
VFQIFTELASWLSFSVLGLSPDTKLGDALHFFIEDTSKIFALLLVMIYLIALLRASMNVERVRDFLAGKNRGLGYLLASGFGAITPFCSCSSIPVFLGFTSAGIPVGITMAFKNQIINQLAELTTDQFNPIITYQNNNQPHYQARQLVQPKKVQ